MKSTIAAPISQEMIAAGPATLEAVSAPSSQPDPIIDPTEANMRPTRPTRRCNFRWGAIPIF